MVQARAGVDRRSSGRRRRSTPYGEPSLRMRRSEERPSAWRAPAAGRTAPGAASRSVGGGRGSAGGAGTQPAAERNAMDGAGDTPGEDPHCATVEPCAERVADMGAGEVPSFSAKRVEANTRRANA